MLKEYKTIDELILILKQRNVEFNNNEELMKDYLNKYSYNSVINPYKVMYCTKILENGSHVYRNSASAIDIIKFLKEVFNLIIYYFNG